MGRQYVEKRVSYQSLIKISSIVPESNDQLIYMVDLIIDRMITRAFPKLREVTLKNEGLLTVFTNCI